MLSSQITSSREATLSLPIPGLAAKLVGRGQMWHSSQPHLRLQAAQNLALPAEAVRQLAADSEPEVRRVIASTLRHRCVPQKLWEQLAIDEDSQVRLYIAASAYNSLPVSVWERLLTDPDSQVAAAACANQSCPPELLPT